MTETQTTVGEWADATFPGFNPDSPATALRVLEEAFELCSVSGASCNDIIETVAQCLYKHRGASFHPEMELELVKEVSEPDLAKIPAEAADVLITLQVLAHRLNFNLDSEVQKKMAVNRSRLWKARGDGTGQHIKDMG